MENIFSKIVKKELKCFKVFEDKKHLAFLDIRPNTKGHTLCIPKKENDYIFDLTEKDYLALLKFARTVAVGIKKAIDWEPTTELAVGLGKTLETL